MWTISVLGCFLMVQFCGGSTPRTAGRDFATAFMQNFIANYDKPVYQLQITSLHSNCCVTVSVPSLRFTQKEQLTAGQGVSISLPGGVELYGSQRSSNTILIQATQDVVITSMNSKLYTQDITVVYPMREWGVDYMIVTPSVSPPSTQTQLMFVNGDQPNTVEVSLRADVQFQGKVYIAGSKLVVETAPYESVQIQSNNFLTGTRIQSRLPVGVYTGHTCTWLFAKCNHVYDQLLPVPSWGTRYLVPPMSVQSQYDSVFVQASQATNVTVRSSSSAINATLNPGQVVEYKVSFPNALSITADKGVQVIFMFNGVQMSWSKMYDSFMINLVSNDTFCYSYALGGQDGFDNRALLVVPSKDVAGVRFNGAPLSSSVQWRVVEKSEYSWAELIFQPGLGRHNVTHPSAAFGVYSVGLALMNGYGASALCTAPVICTNLKCNVDEDCQMKDFTPTCVKKPNLDKAGFCWAMGDPHYRSFDGRYFDFMGACTYVLTKNCESNSSLPAFEVQTQNDNRGNTQISFVALVIVKVGGITITIDRLQKGRVTVDQTVWTLPVLINEAGVNVSQSGLLVTVQTGFGLTVQYDWDSYLLVTLPPSFRGKVCGLCGNFNSNPDDDLMTPSNTQAPSAMEFGCSWKVLNLTECLDCEIRDFLPPVMSCPDAALQQWLGPQDCGILNITSNGPFSRCLAVIDPTVYIQNCLYDTCMNGGLRLYLCKALEVYAGACQRAGVQLSDWRGVAKCSYSCTENSHYELCGSACPATCVNPRPPTNCSLPCVETCTCNPGYVLSGVICVPSNSCGCSQNGRYVPPGESFWANASCSTRCRCPDGGGQLVCENTGCKLGQQCQVVNGIRDCYAVSQSTCLVAGDPHYITFDGTRFDFQGNCVYLLVGVCSSDPGLVPFEVRSQNEFRGSTKVSFLKMLQVNVYNLTIIISREFKGSVMVNGALLHLPQNLLNGQVLVFKSGWSAVVQTSFGLTVAFDWNSVGSVSVPSTYMAAVCGLCGNYNSKPGDDLMLRGTNFSSSSPDNFGESWKVADVPGCVNACSGNCSTCEAAQRQIYASADYCGLILDPNGPFTECQALLDPSLFFENCVYDVCAYLGRKDILCQAISAYMSACQDIGARVYPWRTADFCGVQCPPHSHYDVCGPGCPATCYGLGLPLSCQRPCKESCVCDQGFILSGDDCVPFSQCGCLYNAQYYSQGQVFYPGSLCQTECRCTENGQVVCRNFSCGPYESCVVVNGVRQCQPVGNAVCQASGDPHYLSFDGFRYDFQGSCRYTLSQSCGLQGTSLVPFSVEVENERWPNSYVKVSVSKQVSLAVFGYTFVLRRSTAQILVNGLLTNLPWSLNDTKVRIYKEGTNYVMMTDFGLRVTYDLWYYVTVTVPSSYLNRTCGLCGNYDGNPRNDLVLPSGNTTTDVNLFGKAWKVLIPGVDCVDFDSGPDADCNPKLRAIFEAPTYCGLISDPSGPFAACHAVIDPSGYLQNCVFDVCVSGGSSTVACHGVAAYASKCQTAGVVIKKWRTDSFCPLSCPQFMHYELCADTAAATCPGLTDIIQYSSRCAEGCTCDIGYLFNGLSCVPYEDCGCMRDGRMFKPNEVVYLGQCQQRCVCDPVTGLICESPYICPNGTQCGVRAGILGCFLIDPCQYMRCGLNEICRVSAGQAMCVPAYSATCWARGDPHYFTFDGFYYDFQGTCTYTLSQTCGPLNGLEPFSVTESNDNRGSTSYSYVREVEVKVYGITITIQKYQWGQVTVDGEKLYLPLMLLDHRVQVQQVGSYAVVQTDFGLQLKYDWNSDVNLQLPGQYYQHVCGLCGNFNGNQSDELIGPGGVQQATVIQWASSWRTNASEPGCRDTCDSNCPVCSSDQQKLYNSDAYCGVLSTSDLFKPCSSKVDPAVFQKTCVYDLCLSNGNHRMLCDALQSYASMCRMADVVLLGWREKFNCPMRCQPNSHYEGCATSFNTTCPTPQQQPNRTGVCVEACVCDPGFLLSGSTCVPAAQCGCYYEGHYYQLGQGFWADKYQCRWCVCDPGLSVVICYYAPCLPDGAVVDGPTWATCEAFGDPHYRTFDGLAFDFQGTSVYQLVALCSNRTYLAPFNVTVQNENRGRSAVSFTRAVTVSVFGVVITITREYPRQVLFNGVLMELPLEMQNMLVIHHGGNAAVLETSFGLRVTFDWISTLRVTLPNSYSGAVCGLCGNFNGSTQDDMAMPGGSLAPNAWVLGQSWQVGGTPDSSSGPPPTQNCTAAQMEEAKRLCSIISDPAGPFRACHRVVVPGPYENDCVFDTCQYPGLQSVLCDAVAAYVSVCQSKGVTLQPWRNNTFCPQFCPPHSNYSLCVPGCVQTCASVSWSCSRSCAEGCQCEPGYVFSGQACVPLADCGCFYGGRYYRKDQVFYSDLRCQVKCRCGENGAVSCQKVSCGPSETCGLVNGVLGCRPRGNGVCTATGDPHYTSFDGRVFDFQGVCVYTLAAVCQGDGLEFFSVKTENEGAGRVSEVKAVTVFVYNTTICIRLTPQWRVMVNSEVINLPAVLNSGRILLTAVGLSVNLRTDFGLQVFHSFGRVVVQVPSNYNNSMCGLCGNYNGDPSDDFLLPGGNRTTDVDAFGQAWALTPPGVSCRGCDGVCPQCDPAKEALYRRNDSCGIISSPIGPFSCCHTLVDPQVFVNNCVFDMCAMNGDRTVLCQSLQAYATACQQAGAAIQTWRNISLCPVQCPPNSHYSLCSDNCANTCASLALYGSVCPAGCVEGCQCDEGFVWSGGECVPVRNCGCVYNGTYLKVGESYVSSSCGERYVCQPGGDLLLQAQACSPGEVCEIRDGSRGCYPAPGQCVISSDTQILTFDGVQAKVDQAGAFQMAFLCDDRSPDWFRVVINVQNCASYAGPGVFSIYVYFEGTSITVNFQKVCWVNGRKVAYPSTPVRDVMIRYTGSSVVIERGSSIKVEYTDSLQVTLTVSDRLAGGVCGACGNFNKNRADDLVAANGTSFWNAEDFFRCGQ